MKKPKKILLVDDDITSIYLTQRSLKNLSVEVDIQFATDGLEALEIVHQVCAQEDCPELILLDLEMPLMDGFEFLAALQQSAELSKTEIKIILISTYPEYLDRAKASSFPALDYLEKPLIPEKLQNFLK